MDPMNPKSETKRKRGRPKGSKTLKTKRKKDSVLARLDRAGMDVIDEMIDLIRNPNTSERIRADLLKDLLAYTEPKRAAVRDDGSAADGVQFVLNMGGVTTSSQDKDDEEG